MSKKTKIIFITTFIITLIVAILVYLWINKDTQTDKNGNTPWYQEFNPFGTSGEKEEPVVLDGEEVINEEGEAIKISENSKFLKITDYAISGATFVEENRLKDDITKNEIKQITETVKPDTLEGRKEIQKILNKELSLTPPLVVDGVFGKKVTQAIKDFQKLKNLSITGTIDEYTGAYFTKTVTLDSASDDNKYEKVGTVRFVERRNGHIYKMFLDKKTRERISNSTIPVIYEAYFNENADTVIYRNLSEKNIINSFMATLGSSLGEFLPENIIDLSVSKDGQRFFYLVKSNNSVIGTIRNFTSGVREIVFNHPFTEWLSQWDNNGNIYLTTKASYDAEGSIFILNKTTQTINKIFGDVSGLTTLISPDGTSLLYSYSTNTGPKLGLFNIKDRSNRELNLYGLAEKCVWLKDSSSAYCGIPNEIKSSNEPDLWYQGVSSFDDLFIKLNTNTGEYYTIANSKEEVAVDAYNLFLDKDEKNLFFTNKKDSSFWSLNLE